MMAAFLADSLPPSETAQPLSGRALRTPPSSGLSPYVAASLAGPAVRAFPPRLSRLARRRSAYRTYGRSGGRSAPISAMPYLPLQQNPATVAAGKPRPMSPRRLSSRGSFSWGSLLQSWRRPRVIVDGPRVHQWPVVGLEVCPPTGEPSQHVFTGYVMPALPDSCSDAPQRYGRRTQPKENHFEAVTAGPPTAEAGEERPTTQGRLESEILAGGCEPFDFGDEHPPRSHGRILGTKGRKTGGDEVGVHEVPDTGFLWEKLPRERRFARAVRSGDHDASRRLTSGLHENAFVLVRAVVGEAGRRRAAASRSPFALTEAKRPDMPAIRIDVERLSLRAIRRSPACRRGTAAGRWRRRP